MEQENKKRTILSLDNLKKYFVNQGYINKAVDGVSFDVHEGEIVGLIGESGSGKTTVGRTLLRLYEDYNGFVRLNDKIISGKHITNKRRKFLRRNIQMIFQDPHASLNGQKTVYSILKEPLLVNGVMKEKLDDLFSDWSNVKNSFKYTFQINAMALDNQNYREINKAAKPFFDKWVEKLSNFEFSVNYSNEDNFTHFFGYLEEKQNMESTIINNMYSNTSKLLELYYDCQQKYRNEMLSAPEVAFVKAKKQYARKLELAKYSAEAYAAKEELQELKKLLKHKKEARYDLMVEANNTFVNFVQEYRNEMLMANISRLAASDLDYYLYNFKMEKLYAKRIEAFKEIRKKCKFLEFEQIKDISNELDKYVKEFYHVFLENIHFNKYELDVKKQVVQQINKHFDYFPTKYVQISIDLKNKFDNEILDIQNRINGLNEIIVKGKRPVDKELVNKIEADFKKIEDDYILGMDEFLKSYRGKIEKFYAESIELKVQYHELVNAQTLCNQKYEEIKKKFWDFLKFQIKDEKSKKEIESLIKIYKGDLELKEETLKSFNIEKKYLNKDIKNLYILLGIDNKWVELNIKNAKKVKTETGEKPSSWKHRKNIFNFKFFEPLARWKIGELLYKTIIYKSLEDVGLLKQFAYRYPHEFSGGQLQRIVIARALISEPKVVVADEPIASLDISIQAQVVNLLKDLCVKKNIGLIFIAHDLSMVEYVADNIQIMHLGKIVEFGKTEAIYEHPIHPYTINLFKAVPKISNSNEKFQNVSFELDYLEAQKFPNIPEVFNVGPQHYVYGTREQVNEWTAIRNQTEKEKSLNDDSNDETVLEYTLIMTNDKVKKSKVKPRKKTK